MINTPHTATRHESGGLVTVTEGRFTYETSGVAPPPALTREQALEHFGTPVFVGHTYSNGESPGSIGVTLMSPEYPDHLAEHLLPRFDENGH